MPGAEPTLDRSARPAVAPDAEMPGPGAIARDLSRVEPVGDERAATPFGRVLVDTATDTWAPAWTAGRGMRWTTMTANVVPTRQAASACIVRLPGTRTGVRPEIHAAISTTTQMLNHSQAIQARANAACTIQLSATGLANS